ncbi:MFS transporter [Streptomyces sp. JJ36]|uniref:CynX/NimT family MFS transporter n=1 Tax=Streptomyces sp. JJ36 TaxID=2736645 RepID=UPI001F315CC0|nr:MFS transporter [Streptomyces sp. JJ36]MCF6525728.1 MFS transporter [Streptomyces sp. JJ36]
MATADDDLKTRSRTPASAGSGPSSPSRPPAAGPSRAPGGSRRTRLLVAAGLVLAALNLRPAVSGLGPLLEEVRAGLGMSGTVAGLLTAVPSLCFAVFGGLAPRLARRWGPAAVVLAGMAAVTAGLALRSFAGHTAPFLAASALALAGIAVSNVLMPVVVKHWFPDRVGSMTGLYSMALALGTAGAAAVTVPMTEALGGSWRVGLGAWAVLGVLALAPWTAVLRDGRPAREPGGGAAEPAGPASPAGGGGAAVRITRSPTAWALGVFFGLQASAAYITMGWLPQIFRDAGVSASAAGAMLAVTMGMGIPLSFVLPRIAARLSHQGPLVAILGLCGLSGYAGLWSAPASGAWAWALLLGVSNCAFPLVLTMIGMRSRTSAGVVKLSAFAQSTGYLLSIPGPLLVGALRQHSGGWHLPLLLMTTLMVVQIGVGMLAGRDRCVEDGR